MKKTQLTLALICALFTLPFSSAYVCAEDTSIESETTQGDDQNYSEDFSSYDESDDAADADNSDDEMNQDQE